jgi:RNA polymerase sigma factor (sigma-70 family)
MSPAKSDRLEHPTVVEKLLNINNSRRSAHANVAVLSLGQKYLQQNGTRDRMIKRTTIVEQFSTFIRWEDNRFRSWHSEPRLQRSIANAVEQNATLTAFQWVVFCHSRLDTNDHDQNLQTRQSRDHLYAYLQEPCYQAAYDIWNTYRNYSTEYAIADYFQFGILRFDKLLSGFNPQLNASLDAYANSFLKWRITDTLRERHKGWGYTNWSLLLYRSKLCVKNALIRYGIAGALLESYLLTWECYVEIYKPAKQVRDGSIQEPTPQHWQTITSAYNAMTSSQKEAADIKTWILDCGKAVSSYISLNSVSCDGLNRKETQDLESRMVDESQIEAIDFESVVDYQQIHQKICVWLQAEIEALDTHKTRLNPNLKEILELYYKQGLKQAVIGQKLGIDQTTVARNLQKIKKILTDRFIQWSEENLNIALKSNDIELMSKVFEEWIRYYYQNTVREI